MKTETAPLAVYIDGACIGNPGPGGWAAVLYENGEGLPARELSGGEAQTTNNRMELTAAIRVLEYLPQNRAARLCTDSQYVQLGITEWIRKWRMKDFRGVKNEDLWRRLDSLAAGRAIEWQWVRGHANCAGNILADAIANEQARAQPPGGGEQ